MVLPAFLVILGCVLIPFSFFATSNIFAMAFQASALIGYGVVCIKIWRARGRCQHLRGWLPLGYPVVELATNLILLAIALTRGYL